MKDLAARVVLGENISTEEDKKLQYANAYHAVWNVQRRRLY